MRVPLGAYIREYWGRKRKEVSVLFSVGVGALSVIVAGWWTNSGEVCFWLLAAWNHFLPARDGQTSKKGRRDRA